MSIDIRDLNGPRPLTDQRPASEGAATSGHRAADDAAAPRDPADATRQASSDRVDLSPTARQLKALEGSVRAAGDVDTAKVDRIRQEIAEGRYHVDADRLAGRMIDLEKALLG